MIENTCTNPPPFIVTGIVEASEARGQAQLVASELLPSDMGRQRSLFERMGFKFGVVVSDDPLFVQAELPTGWKKRPTDHSMWSEIIDERGVVRVRVFYKASFYDRRADMHLVGRIAIDSDWGDDYREAKSAVAKVVDRKTGKLLFEATGTPKTLDTGYVSPAVAVAEEIAREWCAKHIPGDSLEAWFQD